MKDLTEKTPQNAYARLMMALESNNPLETLSRIFLKLLDATLDELVLYQYIYVMQNTLAQDTREMGHTGWSPLQRAWVDAGIVKLMMTVAQSSKISQWPALSSFFALTALWDLTRVASIKERRSLLRQMLDLNVVQVCTAKIEHELAIHRGVAVNIIRCLATESFLGETLSSKQCSDIIVVLCQHILSAPEFYSKQFRNPETTWQSFVCFGSFGQSREKAGKYGPRYFGMSQENAAFAIQGLLMTSPRLSQQFYYEVVEHNPEVLDLMFKCASLPRFPWYPECQMDSLLCESLTLLVRVPHGYIPGLGVKADHKALKALAGEWDSVLQTVKILLNRPKGLKNILEVWEVLEDEHGENILSMVKKAGQYHAQELPDMESFFSIFEYRGSVRVSIERLIATVSYVTTETEISSADLLSLLRITNQGLRDKFPQGKAGKMEGKCYAIESNYEIYRKPLYAIFTEDLVEPQMQVADEATIGPTAHARILTLLARRGMLTHISRRPEPLKGTSARLTLPLLRQLTSDAALKKFAALGRKRLTERKDEGLRRFKDAKEADYACIAYVTAAELAAALIAFDDATHGAYAPQLAGARRDLVLCLGNAAQMALNLRHYDRALCYAAAAVEYVRDLPSDAGPEAVSAAIREKNHFRVDRAREESLVGNH